jgi:hypothetical protein
MIADMQAEADGITAYFRAHNIDQPPATVNDVIAVTAFIGSIFGAGGGAEASNAEFLSQLQNHLGADQGRKAWEDAMLFGDPEAPTTINQRFDYGVYTGGPVTGSATIDEGSVVSLDPRQSATPSTAPAGAPAATLTAASIPAAAAAGSPGDQPTYPAAGPVPAKQASNFLIVDPTRSADTKALAVMGPQLGYYYPEIVEQIHLSGPGIEAQGIGDDVHPHRPHPGLRLEPDLREPGRPRRVRRAALQPGRHAADQSLRPLPVPGRVPPVRALRRGHARRHADRVPAFGARPGHRHRDLERPPGRAHSRALHVRA